ncbi:MAG: hypothetical protein E5V80_16980, partial [Mesorhizobium sp.]
MASSSGPARLDRSSSFAPLSVLPDISPSRGEIKLVSPLSLTFDVAKEEPALKLLISPLEGEM